MGKRIEELSPSAKPLKSDGGKAGGQKSGGGRPDRDGQILPKPKPDEFNRTESRAANAVGMSRAAYREVSILSAARISVPWRWHRVGR